MTQYEYYMPILKFLLATGGLTLLTATVFGIITLIVFFTRYL